MRVFSVIGYTMSGKTTTIEHLIKELRKRNYSVGSVKDIHFEGFQIDTKGTNTHRHKEAGSQLVTARGFEETDVLFQEKLDIYQITNFYNVDYLILEGVREANVPVILAADSLTDLDSQCDGRVFMVSGKIADEIDSYKDLPALSALEEVSTMVDCIEETTFEMLPDFDPKCCDACGLNCRDLCMAIIKGERKRSDCIISNNNISLKVDGNEIAMVPFVQNILRNAIMGVVGELDGGSGKHRIDITLGGMDASKGQ